METIIFLIIIGIISSIFNKLKGDSKSPRTKPFIPQRFEEVRTLFDAELEESPPKRTGGISSGQPAVQTTDLHNIGKKHHQHKQELDPAPAEQIKINSQSRNTPKVKNEDETLLIEPPSNQSIINGIIWSEILGEPRSRRPYSAKKT